MDMLSLFCAYCFQEISDASQIVTLQFSPEQAVNYHPEWWDLLSAR